MAPDALELAIGTMIAGCGRAAGEYSVEPLSASGNNRVFMVRTRAERLVAKWYYHDPADPRDRLGAECAFLEYAWGIGLRCVPRLYGRDDANYLALHEFVEGEKIGPEQVNAQRVMEAAQFLASLNSADRRAQPHLPPASEACFSVAEHFHMIDGRIARLAEIVPTQNVDRDAVEFVRRLSEFWELAKHRLQIDCAELGLALDALLQATERCLSPSDFGFHNALLRPDGSLCFIDFEYAGWDDPAKAVGDFFSHPGVPVSRTHFDAFLLKITTPFQNPAASAARVRVLEPLFRLKWCCIILNEFLPDASRRRKFADSGAASNEHKARQLAKANTLFKSMQI